MRFYVTIKRWSHLMLPSNKQISQSHAGIFEITLKEGVFFEVGGGVIKKRRKWGKRVGWGGGGGGLHQHACSVRRVEYFFKSFTLVFFFLNMSFLFC